MPSAKTPFASAARNEEFVKLQKEWYEKLRKEGFKDIEFTDDQGRERISLLASTSPRPNPLLYESRQTYYLMLQNYYTHRRSHRHLSKGDSLIFKLHMDGVGSKRISKAHTAKYGKLGPRAIRYRIQKLVKKALHWNRTSPLGSLYEPT